jgi:hypothetical protein
MNLQIKLDSFYIAVESFHTFFLAIIFVKFVR